MYHCSHEEGLISWEKSNDLPEEERSHQRREKGMYFEKWGSNITTRFFGEVKRGVGTHDNDKKSAGSLLKGCGIKKGPEKGIR